MAKTNWCGLALSVLCVGLSSFCCAEQKEFCPGPHRMYVGARYTTPMGIGFNQGYATLDGFFAPLNFLQDAWLPFLDVRGHVFDSGRCAANTGLGIRCLAGSRLWGVNAYYDYRNSSHGHYNQVAAGFEALGRVWDFRINGYLPVGKKQSRLFNSSAAFQGNILLIQFSQFVAMKGVNAEVGAHVDRYKSAPLYFAAGPYYLTEEGKTAWGGEFRARVYLFRRYLRIEGYTSYDHLFKWIGGAQVSVNVPFGGRTKVAIETESSCSQTAALLERSMQPVDRFEIIAKIKKKTVAPAINPATGQPWLF